ncbi:ABC-2 family transporter protein [Clostridium isatidis]|nr:hypothetical protein [Clostridiales bacterium]
MELLKALSLQVVWIIILSALAKFIWKMGIKRYESSGS